MGVLCEREGAASVQLPDQSFRVATLFNTYSQQHRRRSIAFGTRGSGIQTMATPLLTIGGSPARAALMAGRAPRHAADGRGPNRPAMLWAVFGTRPDRTPAADARDVNKLLQPLRVFHQDGGRAIEKLTYALTRFRETPTALAICFFGAVLVQAILVLFYLSIARSMNIPIGFGELAVIVPVSFIVQMVPVSMNGFGVREATFGFYFPRRGLPLESALLVSFVGAALIMLFSLSGGVAYLRRTVVS